MVRDRAVLTFLTWLLLPACFDFGADLRRCVELGRCPSPPQCDSNEACTAPEQCVLGRCQDPTPRTCTTTTVAATACGNDRDLYFAPDGDDANPGTLARPLRTPMMVQLLPGDRLHLAAGTYTGGLTFMGSGRADCPITLDGAPGYATELRTAPSANVSVVGSHWRLGHFRVRGRGFSAISAGITVSDGVDVRDVIVSDVQFQVVEIAQVLASFEFCSGCALIGSRFESVDAGFLTHAVLAARAPDFVYRGNTSTAIIIREAVRLNSSPNALVEANDFRGHAAAIFESPQGRFTRNVVRDVMSTVVSGADDVVSNTFVNNGAAIISDHGRFANNLVSLAQLGSAVRLEGSGYNLFNTVTPYGDGGVFPTDRVALPRLDADLMPQDGSPALDAADPTLAVPFGGGTRADIGALERGAIRGPDGRYCFVADAGP